MTRQGLTLNILPLRPRWTRLIDLIKPSQQPQWCDELAWFC